MIMMLDGDDDMAETMLVMNFTQTADMRRMQLEEEIKALKLKV